MYQVCIIRVYKLPKSVSEHEFLAPGMTQMFDVAAVLRLASPLRCPTPESPCHEIGTISTMLDHAPKNRVTTASAQFYIQYTRQMADWHLRTEYIR